ncbi:putative asparagine synthetase [Cardiosporidium cionae]|uniref:asparagine synthase (glutamine-hydrolyzing) n=1 Tax=Cardiosporidium cionae TaxID=476202 RepID=A0ABQ7J8C2_9APIC|nr:putative asparagine synthetase [Cardiosporidium cionae]|eukprot:KAF8820218.1 putative asparagine synthetase [Cardiosporidium cionae]
MCGILSILQSTLSAEKLRECILRLSKRIRHRGPDWNGIHLQYCENGKCNAFSHERLAIVNPSSGRQPLFDDTKDICVTVNGEIYNYMYLQQMLENDNSHIKLDSKSDCAVIPFLYKEYGESFVTLLSGDFAFVLSDISSGFYMAARDPFGVCPLYIGYGADGSILLSSEMKCISDDCCHFEVFPPGCIFTSKNNEFIRYFRPSWWEDKIVPSFVPFNEAMLISALETAVHRRMMSDVPFGILLSGGLDSSIITYIATRKYQETSFIPSDGSRLKFDKLHSFSIGLENSPDSSAAIKVAAFLGTIHHAFTFTFQEGLDSLRDVIWHLETYDITTIRAATPLFLLCRYIKSLGFKMVLSGEGADELFGGYLYFRKAPSKEEFFHETSRKMKCLHLYDLLRANKASMAWGVEVRVPFMDKDFVDLAMLLDPLEKLHTPQRMEKYLLRRAFTKSLPEDIVWRQKEQFSDGVGYSWIDGLREYANEKISHHQLTLASRLFPHNTPLTKEAYMYRQIFSEFFPHNSADKTVAGGPSIACSSSVAVGWDEAFKANPDQSGRAIIGVHKEGKRYF